jgi:murein L,D-transpeptidase YcbB/YkuD
VENASLPAVNQEKPQLSAVTQAPAVDPAVNATLVDIETTLESGWLNDHQHKVWQGLAQMWNDSGPGMALQAACDGDNSHGYACLRDQGSWSKIKHLGLPVVLILQGETPAYLLLRGVDEKRLLVGSPDRLLTVSRDAVDSNWLGAYFVVWPQASGWPVEVSRGDTGPAVTTIMEMAVSVDVPYHGGQVFDAAFELWLKGFQVRNGLEADGIVGRKTLLYLMKASIKEPKLLQTWM